MNVSRVIPLALLLAAQASCGESRDDGGDVLAALDIGVADVRPFDASRDVPWRPPAPDVVDEPDTLAPPDGESDGSGGPVGPARSDRIDVRCDAERVLFDPYPRELGGAFRLATSFELPPGIRSFMVVSWDGTATTSPDFYVYPDALEAPDGLRSYFRSFELSPLFVTSWGTGGRVSSLMLPIGPSFERFVQAGRYRYEVVASGVSFCHYVLTSDGPGDWLGLNVIFVGAGPGAAAARSDADWAAAVTEMVGIFDGLGVTIDTSDIRYTDASEAVASSRSVLRSLGELQQLLGTSAPVETFADAMRINLFVTQGFTGELEGVAGIAGGLPGAAGLHGGAATGVVVAADGVLGERTAAVDGNRLFGQIAAHELGHFLGLYHTTEGDMTLTDPLPDTPSCVDAGVGSIVDCPDANNLMFPVALNRARVETSEQQSEYVRLNPLVRPRTVAQPDEGSGRPDE